MGFSPATLSPTVSCQFIWLKKIYNIRIRFRNLSNNNLNIVGQFFDNDWSIKSWKCVKVQFRPKKVQFQCC